MVAAFSSIPWRESAAWSLSDLLRPLLWWFVLPIGVAALLLYGSSPGTAASTKGEEKKEGQGDLRTGGPSIVKQAITTFVDALVPSDRRHQAQWAGVIVGILAGSRLFYGGAHLALRTARIHDWISTAGITASSLALLPLAILGIWKPRVAASILAASFVVALAYPMWAAHGIGNMVAYLPWAAIPALPMALVAGLFLYASAGWRLR